MGVNRDGTKRDSLSCVVMLAGVAVESDGMV